MQLHELKGCFEKRPRPCRRNVSTAQGRLRLSSSISASVFPFRWLFWGGTELGVLGLEPASSENIWSILDTTVSASCSKSNLHCRKCWKQKRVRSVAAVNKNWRKSKNQITVKSYYSWYHCTTTLIKNSLFYNNTEHHKGAQIWPQFTPLEHSNP